MDLNSNSLENSVELDQQADERVLAKFATWELKEVDQSNKNYVSDLASSGHCGGGCRTGCGGSCGYSCTGHNPYDPPAIADKPKDK